MEILAKDFNTRQELETKVSSLFGLTTTYKPDHIIKGAGKELKKLFLGHAKVFWGIKCEQTDLDTAGTHVVIKINRGEIHKSVLEDLDIGSSKELECSNPHR